MNSPKLVAWKPPSDERWHQLDRSWRAEVDRRIVRRRWKRRAMTALYYLGLYAVVMGLLYAADWWLR